MEAALLTNLSPPEGSYLIRAATILYHWFYQEPYFTHCLDHLDYILGVPKTDKHFFVCITSVDC